MLLRFHQDVVALRPAVVMILAGINDVQGFIQQESVEQIETNWETMVDIAKRHDIRVVFGSILPVNDYTAAAHDVVKERRPAELRLLNGWLRAFCARGNCVYADYAGALVDEHGLMGRDYTIDGIHPLDTGYARMAPIASAAIAVALNDRRRK